MIKKLVGSLKKSTYFFYDQETGESVILELRGRLRNGIMQIEKDGQLIDIQIKNIYRSAYETRVNYVQLKHAKNLEVYEP